MAEDTYVAAVAYHHGRSQTMLLADLYKKFQSPPFVHDGGSGAHIHDATVQTWYKRGYQDYVIEMETALKSEADAQFRFLTGGEDTPQA